MKRTALIPALCLLAAFALSACSPAAPGDQASEDFSSAETSTPAFFDDLGKTLRELEDAHPDGACAVSLDGFPDRAAACYAAPGAEYVPIFFAGHSGDFKKAMTACEDPLKCAGFITRAKFLFPDMDDEMSFEDFFSLIGVDEYEYFGDDDDTITAAGWLRFQYRGMEVMINTNEADDVGVYSVFTGAERVRYDAPASIVDLELLAADQNMVDTVMFD